MLPSYLTVLSSVFTAVISLFFICDGANYKVTLPSYCCITIDIKITQIPCFNGFVSKGLTILKVGFHEPDLFGD